MLLSMYPEKRKGSRIQEWKRGGSPAGTHCQRPTREKYSRREPFLSSSQTVAHRGVRYYRVKFDGLLQDGPESQNPARRSLSFTSYKWTRLDASPSPHKGRSEHTGLPSVSKVPLPDGSTVWTCLCPSEEGAHSLRHGCSRGIGWLGEEEVEVTAHPQASTADSDVKAQSTEGAHHTLSDAQRESSLNP